MWDSSIGSKTGIDSKLGKNLIGAIYTPEMIIFDTGFLQSLDERNFKNGIVEIIKMGAIYDIELFEWLENTNLSKIKIIKQSLGDLRKDQELLFRIMRRSWEDKKNIVQVILLFNMNRLI